MSDECRSISTSRRIRIPVLMEAREKVAAAHAALEAPAALEPPALPDAPLKLA